MRLLVYSQRFFQSILLIKFPKFSKLINNNKYEIRHRRAARGVGAVEVGIGAVPGGPVRPHRRLHPRHHRLDRRRDLHLSQAVRTFFASFCKLVLVFTNVLMWPCTSRDLQRRKQCCIIHSLISAFLSTLLFSVFTIEFVKYLNIIIFQIFLYVNIIVFEKFTNIIVIIIIFENFIFNNRYFLFVTVRNGNNCCRSCSSSSTAFRPSRRRCCRTASPALFKQFHFNLNFTLLNTKILLQSFVFFKHFNRVYYL